LRVTVTKHCPHCQKRIDDKRIEISKASMDEVTALLKALFQSERP